MKSLVVAPVEGSRAEALRAAARYARLAAFSTACALYVLVRYVMLRPSITGGGIETEIQ
jgi:hypothetical protein